MFFKLINGKDVTYAINDNIEVENYISTISLNVADNNKNRNIQYDGELKTTTHITTDRKQWPFDIPKTPIINWKYDYIYNNDENLFSVTFGTLEEQETHYKQLKKNIYNYVISKLFNSYKYKNMTLYDILYDKYITIEIGEYLRYFNAILVFKFSNSFGRLYDVFTKNSSSYSIFTYNLNYDILRLKLYVFWVSSDNFLPIIIDTRSNLLTIGAGYYNSGWKGYYEGDEVNMLTACDNIIFKIINNGWNIIDDTNYFYVKTYFKKYNYISNLNLELPRVEDFNRESINVLYDSNITKYKKISRIGLYSKTNELLGVANLSKPLDMDGSNINIKLNPNVL